MSTQTENFVQPADDLDGKYLTFNIAENFYGITLAHVLEIIQIQGITVVPNVPHYIKGIINLRGKIVPVIDVRLKLGIPERGYDDQTCIVVVLVNQLQVGLIVDRVSEVVSVDSEQMTVPPTYRNDSDNKYLSTVTKLDDRIVLNIDCEKFFKDNF